MRAGAACAPGQTSLLQVLSPGLGTHLEDQRPHKQSGTLSRRKIALCKTAPLVDVL